jgi:hypothetical protein
MREMAEGERATGTPNTIYDLASVLFHALEGGASYDTYIEDAEREGDQELADFFRRVRDEDSDRADEAQRLIAERTSTGRSEGTAVSAEGVAAGVPPRTEPISAAPEPGDVPPRRTEEEVPPLPEPSGDLPGTEPIREDISTTRMGDVPPPPEEVPPERAGEIPMAEEIPSPRAEEVPMAEEVPSGTPPQAPPGDVQRETSSEPLRGTEASRREEEGAREEDRGFFDRALDKIMGEEEKPRREGPDRRT